MILPALSLALIILSACSKEKDPTPEMDQETLTLIQYGFPVKPYLYSEMEMQAAIRTYFEEAQDNMPANNPTTDWGATLGRALFYEKQLSINKTIACASCHIQKLGFSDTARFSRGFDGGLTGRHSMGLTNARYYASGRFFWDERAATLEDQVLMPIQDPVEMGMTMEEVRKRLDNHPLYPILFQRAYGDHEITDQRIARALAQFVRSIVSNDSRFDKGLLAHENDPLKPFSNFSPSENRGKQIFFTNQTVPCAGCHLTRALVTDNPRNNGTYDGDEGAYEHNPMPHLRNAFKAPSLRNVAVRPPYMHRGNIPDLAGVIEHYNSGLTNPDNSLDPHLVDSNGQGVKMHLSSDDKKALVDFLHTLTDERGLTREEYSNPFD